MDFQNAGEVEAILDRFVEGLFLLILDHHHQHVAETDLTMSQAQALRLLRSAPLSTSKLAVTLGISAPAVSQLTDRLVRKQLIERRAAATDRRSTTVVLSERGKRLIDGFRHRRNEIFSEALLRLSATDRSEVIEALDKIAHVLPATAHRGEALDKPSRVRAKRTRRTAVQPSFTSKVVEEVPKIPTRPKRMKIEWD